MSAEEFSLTWDNHHSTLVAVFKKLLKNGILVDCTIAAEGQYLKAHKIILSACSPYFELLFHQENEKNPIVVLKDVKFRELKAIIEFIYSGNVKVPEDHLGDFVDAAESLQIKGIGGGNQKKFFQSAAQIRSETAQSPQREDHTSPTPQKRRRTYEDSANDMPSGSRNRMSECDMPSSIPVDLPSVSQIEQRIGIPSVSNSASAARSSSVLSEQTIATNSPASFAEPSSSPLDIELPDVGNIVKHEPEPISEVYLPEIDFETKEEDATVLDSGGGIAENSLNVNTSHSTNHYPAFPTALQSASTGSDNVFLTTAEQAEHTYSQEPTRDPLAVEEVDPLSDAPHPPPVKVELLPIDAVEASGGVGCSSNVITTTTSSIVPKAGPARIDPLSANPSPANSSSPLSAGPTGIRSVGEVSTQTEPTPSEQRPPQEAAAAAAVSTSSKAVQVGSRYAESEFRVKRVDRVTRSTQYSFWKPTDAEDAAAKRANRYRSFNPLPMVSMYSRSHRRSKHHRRGASEVRRHRHSPCVDVHALRHAPPPAHGLPKDHSYVRTARPRVTLEQLHQAGDAEAKQLRSRGAESVPKQADGDFKAPERLTRPRSLKRKYLTTQNISGEEMRAWRLENGLRIYAMESSSPNSDSVFKTPKRMGVRENPKLRFPSTERGVDSRIDLSRRDESPKSRDPKRMRVLESSNHNLSIENGADMRENVSCSDQSFPKAKDSNTFPKRLAVPADTKGKSVPISSNSAKYTSPTKRRMFNTQRITVTEHTKQKILSTDASTSNEILYGGDTSKLRGNVTRSSQSSECSEHIRLLGTKQKLSLMKHHSQISSNNIQTGESMSRVCKCKSPFQMIMQDASIQNISNVVEVFNGDSNIRGSPSSTEASLNAQQWIVVQEDAQGHPSTEHLAVVSSNSSSLDKSSLFKPQQNITEHENRQQKKCSTEHVSNFNNVSAFVESYPKSRTAFKPRHKIIMQKNAEQESASTEYLVSSNVTESKSLPVTRASFKAQQMASVQGKPKQICSTLCFADASSSAGYSDDSSHKPKFSNKLPQGMIDHEVSKKKSLTADNHAQNFKHSFHSNESSSLSRIRINDSPERITEEDEPGQKACSNKHKMPVSSDCTHLSELSSSRTRIYNLSEHKTEQDKPKQKVPLAEKLPVATHSVSSSLRYRDCISTPHMTERKDLQQKDLSVECQVSSSLSPSRKHTSLSRLHIYKSPERISEENGPTLKASSAELPATIFSNFTQNGGESPSLSINQISESLQQMLLPDSPKQNTPMIEQRTDSSRESKQDEWFSSESSSSSHLYGCNKFKFTEQLISNDDNLVVFNECQPISSGTHSDSKAVNNFFLEKNLVCEVKTLQSDLKQLSTSTNDTTSFEQGNTIISSLVNRRGNMSTLQKPLSGDQIQNSSLLENTYIPSKIILSEIDKAGSEVKTYLKCKYKSQHKIFLINSEDQNESGSTNGFSTSVKMECGSPVLSHESNTGEQSVPSGTLSTYPMKSILMKRSADSKQVETCNVEFGSLSSIPSQIVSSSHPAPNKQMLLGRSETKNCNRGEMMSSTEVRRIYDRVECLGIESKCPDIRHAIMRKSLQNSVKRQVLKTYSRSNQTPSLPRFILPKPLRNAPIGTESSNPGSLAKGRILLMSGMPLLMCQEDGQNAPPRSVDGDKIVDTVFGLKSPIQVAKSTHSTMGVAALQKISVDISDSPIKKTVAGNLLSVVSDCNTAVHYKKPLQSAVGTPTSTDVKNDTSKEEILVGSQNVESITRKPVKASISSPSMAMASGLNRRIFDDTTTSNKVVTFGLQKTVSDHNTALHSDISLQSTDITKKKYVKTNSLKKVMLVSSQNIKSASKNTVQIAKSSSETVITGLKTNTLGDTISSRKAVTVGLQKAVSDHNIAVCLSRPLQSSYMSKTKSAVETDTSEKGMLVNVNIIETTSKNTGHLVKSSPDSAITPGLNTNTIDDLCSSRKVDTIELRKAISDHHITSHCGKTLQSADTPKIGSPIDINASGKEMLVKLQNVETVSKNTVQVVKASSDAVMTSGSKMNTKDDPICSRKVVTVGLQKAVSDHNIAVHSDLPLQTTDTTKNDVKTNSLKQIMLVTPQSVKSASNNTVHIGKSSSEAVISGLKTNTLSDTRSSRIAVTVGLRKSVSDHNIPIRLSRPLQSSDISKTRSAAETNASEKGIISVNSIESASENTGLIGKSSFDATITSSSNINIIDDSSSSRKVDTIELRKTTSDCYIDSHFGRQPDDMTKTESAVDNISGKEIFVNSQNVETVSRNIVQVVTSPSDTVATSGSKINFKDDSSSSIKSVSIDLQKMSLSVPNDNITNHYNISLHPIAMEKETNAVDIERSRERKEIDSQIPRSSPVLVQLFPEAEISGKKEKQIPMTFEGKQIMRVGNTSGLRCVNTMEIRNTSKFKFNIGNSSDTSESETQKPTGSPMQKSSTPKIKVRNMQSIQACKLNEIIQSPDLTLDALQSYSTGEKQLISPKKTSEEEEKLVITGKKSQLGLHIMELDGNAKNQ